MFETTFNNLDDTLRKDAGCSSELDYIEQTSWVLFLKYLDDSKLGKLITLKYKSNTDAERVLGYLGEIRNVFIDFQKHLYIENVG